jgi:predicted PhzF superfamily epimerase YddE/YHI9
MSWPALLIEAFASGPCSGNGAAVVLLPQPLPAADLQAIAASLKQSETAFLLRHGDQWLLRWFTPSCEVQLCGHATLASLIALGHWGWLQPGQGAILRSRSGPLPVQLAPGAAAGAWGSIQLPAGRLLPAALSNPLQQELQRRCGALVSSWSSSLGYWVALLADGLSLAALDGLAAILTGPERAGLVVMAATNSALSSDAAPKVQALTPDYQLRFFAPGLGIDEDPVTGSAHALVAPYWLERTGRHQVVGWQPSQRPGGLVASAAASGMIQLLGSGHLLWDGRLHFKSGDYSCGDGGLGEWAALVSG